MPRLIPLLAALLVAASAATAGAAMAEDHHGNGNGNGGGRHEMGGGRPNGGGGGFREMGGGGGRFSGPRMEGPRPDMGRGEGRMAAPQPYRGEAYPRGGGYERGEQRAEPRAYRYAPEPQAQRADPRSDPRAYAPPPASAYNAAPRRGGYLAPQSGGPAVGDYGRYRLRTPPPGYDWVRTGRGMALVSRSTGQVFDVVPY